METKCGKELLCLQVTAITSLQEPCMQWLTSPFGLWATAYKTAGSRRVARPPSVATTPGATKVTIISKYTNKPSCLWSQLPWLLKTGEEGRLLMKSFYLK